MHMRHVAVRLIADRTRVRNRFGVVRIPVAAHQRACACLEELDVFGRVHAQHGFGSELVGPADLTEICVGDRGADHLGPLGYLGRGHESTAVVERVARMMAAVRVGRDREHG